MGASTTGPGYRCGVALTSVRPLDTLPELYEGVGRGALLEVRMKAITATALVVAVARVPVTAAAHNERLTGFGATISWRVALGCKPCSVVMLRQMGTMLRLLP